MLSPTYIIDYSEGGRSMIDLYGCYFKYGDFDSIVYNIGITNIETDRMKVLQSVQNVNTVRNKRNHKFLATKVAYDEAPISFEIEITTLDGSIINPMYIPMIERSLFNQRTFLPLYPYIGTLDNTSMLHINCIFTEGERIDTDGGIIGYKLVVTADSVMAWSEPIEETIIIDGQSDSFTIKVDSDLNDYIYPEVTFMTGSTGGDITIYNNSDNAERFTSFTNLPAETTFVMRGDINHLSNDMYQFFSDRNFIRLLDGDNNFFVVGDLQSISFNFNNRKFL